MSTAKAPAAPSGRICEKQKLFININFDVSFLFVCLMHMDSFLSCPTIPYFEKHFHEVKSYE